MKDLDFLWVQKLVPTKYVASLAAWHAVPFHVFLFKDMKFGVDPAAGRHSSSWPGLVGSGTWSMR